MGAGIIGVNVDFLSTFTLCFHSLRGKLVVSAERFESLLCTFRVCSSSLAAGDLLSKSSVARGSEPKLKPSNAEGSVSAERFELSTNGLKGRCSAVELRARHK